MPRTKKELKPKKPKLRSITLLHKDAKKAFAMFIRLRDGEYRKVLPEHKELFKDEKYGWYTVCITCDRWYPLKKMSAGHFVTAHCAAVRYDEENVNGQCFGCNVTMSGEQYLYSLALRKKYGPDTPEKLMAYYKKDTDFKLNRAALEDIIRDAEIRTEYYLSHATKPGHGR